MHPITHATALLLSGILAVAQASAQPAADSHADSRAERIRARLFDPSAPGVFFGAHRGDWRNAPENSLRAIQNCIAMGLDIVEIDVRRTADGEFIVFHDKTLERTTTGEGRVDRHTLADIKELFLTNPHTVATRHRVPTLEEAMSLAHGEILVFLDKGEPYAQEIAPILRRTGTTRQTIFFGEYPEPKARAHFGDLYNDIIYIPKVKESTPNLSTYVHEFLSSANPPPVFAVWFSADDAPTVPLISTIRDAGSRVWISTLWPSMCGGHDDDLAIDDPDAHWGAVLDLGATVLLTDRPTAMRSYLMQRGYRGR